MTLTALRKSVFKALASIAACLALLFLALSVLESLAARDSPMTIDRGVVIILDAFEVPEVRNTTWRVPWVAQRTVRDQWNTHDFSLYQHSILQIRPQAAFLILAAFALVAFIRGPARRRRRRRKGWCIPCGYDLTGNESGVCPECGSKT